MDDRLPTSRRDWTSLFVKAGKAIGFTVATGLSATVLYAARGYMADIARSEASSATAQYATLPPKVQSLEEFRSRQEKSQIEQAEKLEKIDRAVVILQTTTDQRWQTQAEQNRRVLELLDRMERQSRKNPTTPP